MSNRLPIVQFARNGLFTRLLAVNVVLFALAFALVAVILSLENDQAFAQRLASRATGVTGFAARQAVLPLLAGDRVALQQLTDKAVEAEDAVYAIVIGSDGREVAASRESALRNGPYGRSNAQKLPARQAARELVEVELPIVAEGSSAPGGRNSPRAGEELGALRMGFLAAWSGQPETAGMARGTAAVLGSLLLLFAVQALWSMSLLNPLHALTDYARERANGNSQVRPPDLRWDELAQLAAAIDRLAGRTVDQGGSYDVELREVRARLDTEICKRDEAEESVRLKSEFLSTMSHEVRTPLNVVIGMSELVLDSDLDAKQRRRMTVLRDAAESLLAMISGILDLSKMDAAKLELEVCEFNLAHLVCETLQILQSRADEKRTQLRWVIDQRVPASLHGDPLRIRQVLLNLVQNAIKFTELGEIAVTVEPESEDSGRQVLRFSIADTGIGIPEEKRRTIFEAFQQADDSTSRRFGGTGLGLTICKRLVAMMNGRIWIEGGAVRGSVFHFTVEFLKPKDDETVAIPNIALVI